MKVAKYYFESNPIYILFVADGVALNDLDDGVRSTIEKVGQPTEAGHQVLINESDQEAIESIEKRNAYLWKTTVTYNEGHGEI